MPTKLWLLFLTGDLGLLPLSIAPLYCSLLEGLLCLTLRQTLHLAFVVGVVCLLCILFISAAVSVDNLNLCLS
jgi:hypothetical protein